MMNVMMILFITMHIYLYIHTYIHIYIHTYSTYTCTYMHKYILCTYIHIYVHSYRCFITSVFLILTFLFYRRILLIGDHSQRDIGLLSGSYIPVFDAGGG